MYVGTSELHFCSPHWIQKYLNPQKTVSLCKTPLSYITPRHTLPLFCPTPCMSSPCSVPLYACPPPILSHPMHTLPLFYPTPCMPAPYSIPPMHGLPLFYPTSCIPSPLFYPSPCIIDFFLKCSHYSAGKVDGYKCDLSRNYVIYGKS